MADFFTRLAARTLGLAPVIRPRRPARFDPAGPEVDGAPEPERLAGTAPPEAAGRTPQTDEKRPAAEAPRPGPASPAEPEPLVRAVVGRRG